jgi:integrase/recombinase XerD
MSQTKQSTTTHNTPAMTAAPRRGADRAALRNRPAAANTTIKRAAVLTADQIAAMLAAATSARDRALVHLLTAGAMRIGEATLLTWGDVDLATGRIAIPGGITKTGAGRSLTLPTPSSQALTLWRQECPSSQAGWIFPGAPARHPISTRQGQRIVARLATACGLQGVSSHSFRRSALTAAHQAGLPLRAVAQISGHRSLAALELYLDAGAHEAQAEAARALLFQPTSA